MTPLIRPLPPHAAAFWALCDQGISSLTNFGLVIVAARMLSVQDFGLFTTAYLVYLVAVGVVQALVGQELVLLKKSSASRVVAIRSALQFISVAAIPPAVILVVVGMAVPSLGASFVVLGCLFPLLMLQEVFRCAASFLRAPQLALAGDLAWLLLLVCSFAVILLSDEMSKTPGLLVVAWALPGALSVAVMYMPLAASLGKARVVWRRYLDRGFLGHRFVWEYFLVSATQNISVLSLGVLASPAVVGALRGVTTLYGPLRTVFNTVSSFGTPLFMDMPARSRLRVILSLSGLFALIALGVTVLFMSLDPAIGQQLLGKTWKNVVPLLLPTGVQFIAMAFSRLGYVVLRLEMPKSTLGLRVVASILFLALFFGGFFLGGIQGAAWGGALAVILQALNAWALFALRRDRS